MRDDCHEGLDHETLLRWSRAWGLGHSSERVMELLPAVNGQVGDLAELWSVDVSNYAFVVSRPRPGGQADE